MIKQTNQSSVTKSIIIQRNLEDTFRLWSTEIHRWWPKSHTISKDPNTQVVMEGKAGGRFFERTSTGVEHDWGSILVWQPPNHFAYHWFLGSNQNLPTKVEVYFVALSPQSTRVEIVHSGPELIGALWGTNKQRYDQAWESVLPEFAKLASNSYGLEKA